MGWVVLQGWVVLHGRLVHVDVHGSTECKHSVAVKEARFKLNSHMATADHDRQGQAAHRRYKSHTVVEFTLGKAHA